MSINADPLRLLTAAALLFVYCFMCAMIVRTQIRLAAGRRKSAHSGTGDWIVAFASQTGTAEDLARQTADTLQLAGVPARICSLSDLDAGMLTKTERILFLASTYGEGDPPDNAAFFAGRVMSLDLPLAHLHYGLLALGDSSYTNFCGFARMLDQWLQRQGARVLFNRIEADRADPEAIGNWRQHLSHLAGTSDLPDWSGPDFGDWRLVERRLLNAGSVGEPVYHIELEPVDAVLPEWQSGDLVQVLAPGDPEQPREYSIASVAEEGRVHLLIRLHRRADGSPGVASGWLGLNASCGDTVKMRLRSHPRFRLENNVQRPLVLIGNGTGMAGLRGHLRSRAGKGITPNWLIFGERNAANDFYYREEIAGWQANGLLERVDLAFSRDTQQRCYVQDRLAEAGDTLRAWVERGAAIYVCGSLKGMAAGVDEMLAGILGREMLDELSNTGRYRRDVY